MRHMPTDRPPIGTRIKRARERQKPRMTQQQLADEVDVSQKTIDNWENDRSYPRSAIGALEKILGPLTDDGTQPPATTSTDYPDFVVGDRFLEHIYDYVGPGDPETVSREKLVAARSVVTHREAAGGARHVTVRRRA